MEEVSGSSYSRRWRHLSIEERLRILAQVADALDYAHHQGVVHRDIKPGNVLLTATDAPKLSDFGLSILIERGDDSGVIRGTPLYMSPEQTRGSQLDFRSDLYSLGVMIYESATGVTPFVGNAASIMAQHRGDGARPARGRDASISEALEGLILGLMSKRPDARPRSGSVVAEALRAEIDRLARERPEAGTGTTATQVGLARTRPGRASIRRRRPPRPRRPRRPTAARAPT